MDVLIAGLLVILATAVIAALIWREWRREEPFYGQSDEPMFTKQVLREMLPALRDEEIENLLEDDACRKGHRPVIFLPKKRKVYYTSNSGRRLAGKAVAVGKGKGFLLRRLHHRYVFWRKPEDVFLAA